MPAQRLRPAAHDTRRSPRAALAWLSLLLVGLIGCQSVPEAELLFRGGQVLSMEDDAPAAEALAVADGRILWLGAEADAQAWIGPDTEIVELAGRTLLPGFADSHLHLRGVANQLAELDLTGVASYQELVRRVREAAERLPPGTWILGRGWDQNDWPDTRLPHHAALSAVTPDHPVALRRIDGHALLANAVALRAADLNAQSVDPSGGRLLRDAEGQLSGVLVDSAMAPVGRQIPAQTEAEIRRRLAAAFPVLHAYGLTSVHDAGVSFDDADRFARLDRDGAFPLRAHLMIRAGAFDLEQPERNPAPRHDLTGSGRVQMRAIKAMSDGALGSRGAALLQPYSDEPEVDGLVITSPERVEALARFALRYGWQLCTHAIGDHANRFVLDAYERALADAPAKDPRLRIEHAQILHPDDLPRFAELGVLPSMQAQHQTSDAPWAVERLGEERTRLAYAWRSLVDSGVRIPGGSDAPVEVPDPLLAFHAAVTRRDVHGEPPGGWHPEQRLTRTEALKHLTSWPAYAAFREHELGSLAPGKLADLVVLSGDPLRTPDDELLDLRVDLTVFEGRIVFERNEPTDTATTVAP